MIKSTVVLAVLVFIAASAFAAPFAPKVMTFSAPNIIQYDFSGKNLSIPVTLTGTPADVSFLVFTKNQGSKISKVTNGYLGWHYVNKIDTCVYMAPSNQMATGANTIIWNGKSKNGAVVPQGDYTYYLFGYDNKSDKILVSPFIKGYTFWNDLIILEKDEKGKPLARPILYEQQMDAVYDGTIMKWIVGNDPADKALLETTFTKSGENVGGYMAVLPADNSKFFIDVLKVEGIKATRKWTWVSNGQAVIDSKWGTNGEYTYNVASDWNFGPGVVSDGKDWLFLSDVDISGAGKVSNLIVINASDGSQVKKLDISQWWVNLKDGLAGGQACGGPLDMDTRNGLIALGAHGTCVNSVMNPYAETADDAVLWVNRNGDYIGDHNFEPTSAKPWVCNDYNTGPYKYNTSIDNQGFVIFDAWGENAPGNSFGLYAPDGTGVAYKNFVNETPFGTDTSFNYFVDYGSPYDGILTTVGKRGGTWFVAHDSFKGMITSNPTRVNGTAPAAFSVEQNTPNPFNPSTTISFTLPKAGKTTVEVFNAAGQKIDTIVNTIMSAGSHSVNWNASKFSAGVYFYTVKNGEFSKTMKMTLLR